MIKNVILVVLNVLWVSLSRCCLEIFRNNYGGGII